jgi:hypothetical protein
MKVRARPGDDAGGRAGFSFALLPTRHIKHMMDAIQRAVVAPQVEIVKNCAAAAVLSGSHSKYTFGIR